MLTRRIPNDMLCVRPCNTLDIFIMSSTVRYCIDQPTMSIIKVSIITITIINYIYIIIIQPYINHSSSQHNVNLQSSSYVSEEQSVSSTRTHTYTITNLLLCNEPFTIWLACLSNIQHIDVLSTNLIILVSPFRNITITYYFAVML